MSQSRDAFPLDLERTKYSYIERANSVLVGMLDEHVLSKNPRARVLDIGCGCGSTAAHVKKRYPDVHFTGVEPNDRAAELARESLDTVFNGIFEDWVAKAANESFDAVVLSDVIEHVVDPVGFMRKLVEYPGVANATFLVSVPNCAVWYNRIRTALGKFDYTWSGLYDRTHLRFYTKRSVRDVLRYTGLEVIEQRPTASIVQSAAPILRQFFEKDVDNGDHLALADSGAFQMYRRFVEPMETAVCGLWPELLGFQIVSAARVRQRG